MAFELPRCSPLSSPDGGDDRDASLPDLHLLAKRANGWRRASQVASPAPAPIFGSAATFTSGGFGGFSGAGFGATASSPAKDGDDDGPADDAECQATFTPVVQLQEVETKTGEEDEDVMFESCVPISRRHLRLRSTPI